MNEIIKGILNRRSIRSYTSETITKEELDSILLAGQYAPSAMNRQHWKFLAIQNQEILKDISETCGMANKDPLYGATSLIFAFADKERTYGVVDCSLALENMMLAASSLGIGSCWIGSSKEYFDSEEGKKLQNQVGLTKYKCVGGCIFGYIKGDTPEPKPRAEESVIYLL